MSTLGGGGPQEHSKQILTTKICVSSSNIDNLMTPTSECKDYRLNSSECTRSLKNRSPILVRIKDFDLEPNRQLNKLCRTLSEGVASPSNKIAHNDTHRVESYDPLPTFLAHDEIHKHTDLKMEDTMDNGLENVHHKSQSKLAPAENKDDVGTLSNAVDTDSGNELRSGYISSSSNEYQTLKADGSNQSEHSQMSSEGTTSGYSLAQSWGEDTEVSVSRMSLLDSSDELLDLVEDREIAARAVAFVVSSSRRGIVPLCADVASLMRTNKRLEKCISRLRQELEVARHGDHSSCGTNTCCSRLNDALSSGPGSCRGSGVISVGPGSIRSCDIVSRGPGSTDHSASSSARNSVASVYNGLHKDSVNISAEKLLEAAEKSCNMGSKQQKVGKTEDKDKTLEGGSGRVNSLTEQGIRQNVESAQQERTVSKRTPPMKTSQPKQCHRLQSDSSGCSCNDDSPPRSDTSNPSCSSISLASVITSSFNAATGFVSNGDNCEGYAKSSADSKLTESCDGMDGVIVDDEWENSNSQNRSFECSNKTKTNPDKNVLENDTRNNSFTKLITDDSGLHSCDLKNISSQVEDMMLQFSSKERGNTVVELKENKSPKGGASDEIGNRASNVASDKLAGICDSQGSSTGIPSNRQIQVSALIHTTPSSKVNTGADRSDVKQASCPGSETQVTSQVPSSQSRGGKIVEALRRSHLIKKSTNHVTEPNRNSLIAGTSTRSPELRGSVVELGVGKDDSGGKTEYRLSQPRIDSAKKSPRDVKNEVSQGRPDSAKNRGKDAAQASKSGDTTRRQFNAISRIRDSLEIRKNSAVAKSRSEPVIDLNPATVSAQNSNLDPASVQECEDEGQSTAKVTRAGHDGKSGLGLKMVKSMVRPGGPAAEHSSSSSVISAQSKVSSSRMVDSRTNAGRVTPASNMSRPASREKLLDWESSNIKGPRYLGRSGDPPGRELGYSSGNRRKASDPKDSGKIGGRKADDAKSSMTTADSARLRSAKSRSTLSEAGRSHGSRQTAESERRVGEGRVPSGRSREGEGVRRVDRPQPGPLRRSKAVHKGDNLIQACLHFIRRRGTPADEMQTCSEIKQIQKFNNKLTECALRHKA